MLFTLTSPPNAIRSVLPRPVGNEPVRAVITLEHRFCRTPDGAIWTVTACPYQFWTRYLCTFDQVRVVARVRDVPKPPADAVRADGSGVTFHAVPDYHGPARFFTRYSAICSSMRTAVGPSDSVIMRVPSTLAMVLEPMLRKRRHPYSLEVVGDPYEVFAPGAVSHPLRPVLRRWLTSALRNQCRRAAGVAYVTRRILQERYPCAALATGVSDIELPNAAFATDYSSIELSERHLLSSHRKSQSNSAATLVFVGSLEQLYKGQVVLLTALTQCIAAGLDLRLILVGEGRYRNMLERLAEKLNIRERCHFLGQIKAGAAVREVLDSGDLFILPSLTEGLPRAMIEAMARALPCIGTKVGGIPELLTEQDMVPSGDASSLARKIHEFVSDPERLRSASQRNLMTAREYLDENLQQRRIEFYNYTKNIMATGSHPATQG